MTEELKKEYEYCEDFRDLPPQEERPYHKCTLCGEYAFEGEMATQPNNEHLLDTKTFVCNECIELVQDS